MFGGIHDVRLFRVPGGAIGRGAFAPFDERLLLINTVLKPGFATARAMSDAYVPPEMLAG